MPLIKSIAGALICTLLLANAIPALAVSSTSRAQNTYKKAKALKIARTAKQKPSHTGRHHQHISTKHASTKHILPVGWSRYAALVMDADTGKILYQKNDKAARHPASLTKLMTLYIVFEALKNGEIKLHDKITISARANSMQPSNLSVKTGSTITVQDAIYGLIVKSANNVSYSVAEFLGHGDVKKFVARMNKTAKALAMSNTRFANPHGLHNIAQSSTASDLAKLAIALRRNYPDRYKMFAKTSFSFNGHQIKGHNRVLSSYPWADGLKTGYITASGYNLITSAQYPNGLRLIAVVLGGPTAHVRDQHMIQLLEHSAAKAGWSGSGGKGNRAAIHVATPALDSIFSSISTKPSEKSLKNTKPLVQSRAVSIFETIEKKNQ